MHQILGLRDYFDPKTGQTKKAEKFFDKNWRISDLAQFFKTPDQFLEAIPEEERFNLYYTVSDCLEEPGRRFLRQRDLPFDIDNIDTSQEELTAKVALQALGLDWYKTAVVASGNGVQFLVRTHEPFEDAEYFSKRRDDYKACCAKINEALAREGLPGKADSSVWSPARLMRLPNTWNEKPNKPKRRASILQGNLEAIMFDFKKAAGIPVVEPEEAIVEWPLDVDTNAVLNGCEQLKAMKENPNSIDEPTWYAALSVLSRLGDRKNPMEGREIAHKYSEGHRQYSKAETDLKIDQAMKASGPRTCLSFNMLNDVCRKCKYWGKVKSPIRIEAEDFIKTSRTRFHYYIKNKSGTETAKADYDGLLKWFKKQHEYKVISGRKPEVYIYQNNLWHIMYPIGVTSFAERWFGTEASSYKNNEFATKVLNQFDHLESREWFNESTNGRLHLLNGVLDIKTRKLSPHSTSYGFQYGLDYAYDESAKAPLFEKFLDEVTCGYDGYKKTLLEYGGYCLSNSNCWAQKALLLVGEGANGKSTFMNVLKSLARYAHSSVPIDDIDNPNNARHLEGKLFNISEEGNRIRNTTILKNLVTGGDVTMKKLYGDTYAVENKAKLVCAMNELPPTYDNSEGFYRRFIIVRFRAHFGEGKADRGMNEKLASERAGILNMFLNAYQDMVKRGACFVSEESNTELAIYHKENDDVLSWFNEYLVPAPGNKLDRDAAWLSYQNYCVVCQTKPGKRVTFLRQLGKLVGKDKFGQDHNGVRYYKDLKLRTVDKMA